MIVQTQDTKHGLLYKTSIQPKLTETTSLPGPPPTTHNHSS